MNDKMSRKVAIIILNYNGWRDTVECLESIQTLDYPEYLTIVVDNGSTDGSIGKIKEWARGELEVKSEYIKYNPNNKPVHVIEYEREIAEKCGIPEMEAELSERPSDRKFVLIKNRENLGFSAGNNVGIRYAINKSADAVLIINPDVRFEDNQTLKKMVKVMFSRDDIYIVGPNIIDAAGNRQSPLKEPGFFKEIINPFLSAFLKIMFGKPLNYLESIKSDKPYEVKKVSGACLMIRTSFLKDVGLLDENVFLYCEEPILMCIVHKYNGKIIYLPTIFVRHLHQAKEENVFKYRQFIKSRLYFLSKYKNYSYIKLALIKTSYNLVLLIKKLRSLVKQSF